MPDESKQEPTDKDPAESAGLGGMLGQGRGGLADWHDMPDWMTDATDEALARGIVGGIISLDDDGDDRGPTTAA
jgi:hypothetical protein